MNTGKYIFSQVTAFLDFNEFNKIVEKYDGNYKVQHFTCWNQLMCMLFGQLSNRESLSDLLICLNTQKNKWYHLGLGIGISKSNLANANEKRNWKIYEDFAYSLIKKARLMCSSDFEMNIEGNIYSVDSSTIDLCLSVFWWATFRKNKGAIKLNTQYDVRTNIPVFVHVSAGTEHDVNFLDKIEYETNAFYILDRGYLDFDRLFTINLAKAYFVTRLKDNTNYRRLYSETVDKTSGVLCDQTILLNNHYASKDYPERLRRIHFIDRETNLKLDFITNNFDLTALEIAKLYKNRWSVELFFKWIKQHLKVKSFWGHSENAVKIQVYTAITTYALVAIIKEQLKIKYSRYEILQILSITLLNKTPLNQLFEDNQLQFLETSTHNQLKMF
jgi:hypothetical protein